MPYTLEQWKQEMEIARPSIHGVYGSCKLRCPSCNVLGFYSPRDGEPLRCACKFCGFWQKVDNGEPFRCESVLCLDCGYFGWHEKFTGKQPCDNCKSLNKVRCPWATDCLSHPFWRKAQEFKDCTTHK